MKKFYKDSDGNIMKLLMVAEMLAVWYRESKIQSRMLVQTYAYKCAVSSTSIAPVFGTHSGQRGLIKE